MKALTVIALLSFTAAPAFAQGEGGYAPGAPGAATAAAPASAVKQARNRHMTNDTSGGTSSIDKSGVTQEGGRSAAGAQGRDQAMGAHAPGNTGSSNTTPTGR